jgi:hypothetical protein
MPATTDIERRDRALIAFTILTGARDGAIASFKLRHIDVVEGKIDQDARHLQTKFSKSFITMFFPVGEDIRTVVADWATYLREKSSGVSTIRCFQPQHSSIRVYRAGRLLPHWPIDPIRGESQRLGIDFRMFI